MARKVMVVDDDPAVRELVCDALNLAGYETIPAIDGLEAITIQKRNRPDLIVTDVSMPKVDGFQLLEKLRELGIDTPVILLTARNQKIDISQGFRFGADDYISKPFGIEELVLRVGAVLRRSRRDEMHEQIFKAGPIVVDVAAVKVEVSGQEIFLSPTEFRLLVVLLENKNKVLSRQFLLDAVWDMGFAESATVVDTYISYLRKKIHTSTYQGLRTVRGFGFQLLDK